MKPINTAQRNSAFLYFLLMFILTTALVVLAVFFGMQVPFKQNEKLKEQLSAFQNEKAFSENFLAKMTDVQLLLDSINRQGTQPEILNGQISSDIANLNIILDKDTSVAKKIYHSIVHNLMDLQTARTQLREASENNETIGQYLQQIAELKDKLRDQKDQAKEYYDQLKDCLNR